MAYTQYNIQVRSPRGVWDVLSQSGMNSESRVFSFGHTNFDWIKVMDPLNNNAVLLAQPITAALFRAVKFGDNLWRCGFFFPNGQ